MIRNLTLNPGNYIIPVGNRAVMRMYRCSEIDLQDDLSVDFHEIQSGVDHPTDDLRGDF